MDELHLVSGWMDAQGHQNGARGARHIWNGIPHGVFYQQSSCCALFLGHARQLFQTNNRPLSSLVDLVEMVHLLGCLSSDAFDTSKREITRRNEQWMRRPCSFSIV
jgi:hypothetical protein